MVGTMIDPAVRRKPSYLDLLRTAVRMERGSRMMRKLVGDDREACIAVMTVELGMARQVRELVSARVLELEQALEHEQRDAVAIREAVEKVCGQGSTCG